jgi:hypothetical protein
MNHYFTLFFTEDYEPTDQEIHYFEAFTGREIGVGDGFINVYTIDETIIKDLIDIIGEFYISEVSPALTVEVNFKEN